MMKTVWQVLEELGDSGDHGNSDGVGVGDGSPMSVGAGGDDEGGAVGDDGRDDTDSIGGGGPVTVAVALGDRDRDRDGGGNDHNNDDNDSIGGGTTLAVSSGGGDHHRESDSSLGGRGPVAVAGGGSTVVENAVVSEGVQGRKRKTCILRDPPTGKPTCPLCQKEFPTWNGVFGHMRVHPHRDYRGFFSPPLFGSQSSTQDNQLSSNDQGEDSAKKNTGEGNSEEKGGSLLLSPVRVPMFDMNEPMEEERSSHAPKPAEDKIIAEEVKGLGFDLNQMPKAED